MKKILLLVIIPFLSFGQEFESNLPIILINTHGDSIVDDPRIIGDMGIIHNYSKLNNLTDPYNNYNGKISIELRGSSSQSVFPKKSYSLETQTVSGENNNVSLLDLPIENDWVLYGAYSDKTLLRNSLTYKISEQMGYYSPRTKYCELFINDEYQGIYILTEKIKRDKNRVNIKEFNDNDPSSGGYIIKIDKLTDAPIDASWCSNFMTLNNDAVCFQYHYPKASDITIEQKNYIEDFINSVHLSLENLFINQLNTDVVENIDFISFIDYLIISELSKDVDAYRISVFMHKDSEENNGRLTMGPVWDYNLSFGNVDFCQSSNISGWVLENETSCRTSIPEFWYNLLQNDSFREKLILRWQELRNNVLGFDNIFNHIDSIGLYVDEAQNRNFEKWEILGQWVWPNYQLGPTYQDELNYLKYWIYNRINWIDQNINEMRLMFPDCSSKEKRLMKITNQLGQEVLETNNEILYYIYDNGCVKKKIITY